jgi:imidazolonepropionase-like amidohydrolase
VTGDTWHLRAVHLPDGSDVEERWLTGRGWSAQPVLGASSVPGRFALPGLVDAHSHVSFGPAESGPVPLGREQAEANRERWARQGVGLVRDAGGVPSVVLNLPAGPGRPHVIGAGRHLAPAGMCFEAVHLPVHADEVVGVALAELRAGARWVKLVADFPPGRARAIGAQQEPEPTYDLDVVQRLVEATHAAGGRIAAHVTTALPREVELLVECGLAPLAALRAATTAAARFLGADAAGVPPSVVTYDADPREDPSVLARPAAVVLGGVRVR